MPLEQVERHLQNPDLYSYGKLEKILSNTEVLKEGQKEIKKKLDEHYQYLIQLPKNESDKKEILTAIKKIEKEQSHEIVEKMIDYMSRAFLELDEEIDDKLHNIYTDLKKTYDWQTKVKLSVPLLNLVGVNIETEFKLNKFIKKYFI